MSWKNKDAVRKTKAEQKESQGNLSLFAFHFSWRQTTKENRSDSVSENNILFLKTNKFWITILTWMLSKTGYMQNRLTKQIEEKRVISSLHLLP
jgi:hypothetical protein